MKRILTLTILVALLHWGVAWRSFSKGRSKDGNLGEPILTQPTDLPKDQWFTQHLDHFNAAEGCTWKQRFFMNNAYYKPYLSSEQALADLAYFIEGMNAAHQMPNGTKWILFGGSYSGSLAKIDFQEYFIVVEQSLKTHSQACVDAVAAANNQVHIMLRHRIGQQTLAKLFNFCDPIDPGKTSNKDIANLYETIADNFADVVQYNKDNRNESTITIDMICNVLVDEKKGVPVDRLAEVSNMLLKKNKEKCLDYKYSKMIDELRNITWAEQSSAGGRQWFYQTCTEFGFFQTSTARPNLFSETFPVDFFLGQCVDVFGPRFAHTPELGVERTNTCSVKALITGKKSSDAQGRKGQINDMQFNKDSTMFVTASKDHTAKLFASDSLIHPINSATISPIYDHVVVGGGQDAKNLASSSRGNFYLACLSTIVASASVYILYKIFNRVEAVEAVEAFDIRNKYVRAQDFIYASPQYPPVYCVDKLKGRVICLGMCGVGDRGINEAFKHWQEFHPDTPFHCEEKRCREENCPRLYLLTGDPESIRTAASPICTVCRRARNQIVNA